MNKIKSYITERKMELGDFIVNNGNSQMGAEGTFLETSYLRDGSSDLDG